LTLFASGGRLKWLARAYLLLTILISIPSDHQNHDSGNLFIIKLLIGTIRVVNWVISLTDDG
jgi:hypothetical protein